MSILATLLPLAEQLEQTALGTALAESTYAFPIVEGLHLIGLSIALGLLFITDLRLAGVILKRVPASVVLQQLLPWVLGGFVVILVTGGLLFVAEASSMLTNPAFAFKLVFIAIAAINAVYFEFVIARRPGALESSPQLPANVRMAGVTSLVMWGLVVICGRLIPYLPAWT